MGFAGAIDLSTHAIKPNFWRRGEKGRRPHSGADQIHVFFPSPCSGPGMAKDRLARDATPFVCRAASIKAPTQRRRLSWRNVSITVPAGGHVSDGATNSVKILAWVHRWRKDARYASPCSWVLRTLAKVQVRGSCCVFTTRDPLQCQKFLLRKQKWRLFLRQAPKQP
jgi:hypothetical protein